MVSGWTGILVLKEGELLNALPYCARVKVVELMT